MKLGNGGSWKGLVSAFFYFDVSFMIWVLCGALALYIAGDFKLSDWEKALMVSCPTLGGALLRIPMGILADRIGSRPTGLIGMAITFVPLIFAWIGGDSFGEVLCFGLLLGIAGASFSVAMPLASRCFPPRSQGMAMGIAGAGNSGTAIATLLAPQIAEHLGWHAVFGIAIIPLALVFVAYFLLAQDPLGRPQPKKIREYLSIFKQADIGWFSLIYSITFGGFVALSTYLGIVYYDCYGDRGHPGGITKVEVGYLVTVSAIAGSFFRPLGGWLADRVGGMRLLTVLLGMVAVCAFFVSTIPPSFIAMSVAASIMMVCLGLGNGAVFQLVPQRFSEEIGVASGVIGAAGGLGGFMITNFVLGPLKQITGTHVTGFITVSLLILTAMVVFGFISRGWRKRWAIESPSVKF